MHLLSNNYLVNQTNNKGNNFTASIPSYVNSTIHPETINNRRASQLNIDGSIALIKVPVGSKPNNQSLHPFEHHPTTNTINLQTLNITNNNQTQTLHVTNMRPYTKHSKYKPRKPRTALVYLWSEHIPSEWENTRPNMQVLTEIKKSHYKFLELLKNILCSNILCITALLRICINMWCSCKYKQQVLYWFNGS